MLEPNYYSVLFTGGLDSTYRLCQLARNEEAVVQPVYIVFPVRPELKREIEAQNKILEYICNHPNTKAKFLPIRRIQRDDIPKDQRILDLEGELAKYNFGWQYLYIALLAKWEPGLELCHETLPPDLMDKKVVFEKKGGNLYIDIQKTDPLFAELFKNLVWPIMDISRKKMVTDLKEWGYDGILKLIWFCYESVNGKPCGFCDNCRKKIEDGLKDLFDKDAIHRYLIYIFIRQTHPKPTLSFYEEYIHKKYQPYRALSRRMIWYFDKYDKLTRLSNKQLKDIIINGSLDYGYSFAHIDEIKNMKNNVSRKHMFKGIL